MKTRVIYVLKNHLSNVFLVTLILINHSCVIKAGNYSFTQEPNILEPSATYQFSNRNKTRLEVDLHSERFLYDRIDISGTIGFMTIAHEGELLTTTGSLFRESTKLVNISIGSNIYPLGVGVIVPAFGAGIGSYRYFWEENRTGKSLGGGFYSVDTTDKTIDRGIRPYVLAAIYIFPLGKHSKYVMMAEYRYNFRTFDSDKGINLSGSQLMFGIGVLWRPD